MSESHKPPKERVAPAPSNVASGKVIGVASSHDTVTFRPAVRVEKEPARVPAFKSTPSWTQGTM
jgi:hypothetical protein